MEGGVVDARAQINAVLYQGPAKMVEVCGTISREAYPVMGVISQLLCRRAYADYENTFQRKVETPVEVHLSLTKDVAVLCSKEWSHLDDSYDVDLPNKELTFWLSSFVRYKDQTVFSSVETMGQVLLELPTKEVIQCKPGPRDGGGGPQTIPFVKRECEERVCKERKH